MSEKEQEEPTPVQQVNLLDLPVRNENEALNVMVGFLGLAQKN